MLVAGLLATLASGCTLEPYPCTTCIEPFDGPSADVALKRDGLGVVHVYGQNDADVFYGAGYAQARDRLFQMDMMRRQALGRRAEVLGPDRRFDDELVRIVGIPEWGRQAAEALERDRPEAYRLLEAWTAGVNARIDEVRDGTAPLPYGFGPAELDYLPEPWSNDDGFIVGKLILFGNANQIEFEILATILHRYFGETTDPIPLVAPLAESFILPESELPASGSQPLSGTVTFGPSRPLPDDAADRLRHFARRMAPFRPAASNNWAIDGAHTDSGRPLVAGDPHQALRTPNVFWAHHLNSADAGGSLDVIGFGFVGTPVVQLGHNRHVAWTATTSYPDVMDLLDVAYDEETVSIGGEPIAIERTTETIAIAGSEPTELMIERVPGHGVLLPSGLSPLPLVDAGRRMLLRWPGLAATSEGEAFLALDQAGDLDAWRSAIDQMEIGNFNFIGATADGIAFHSRPLTPVRAAISDAAPPYRVLDGDDPGNAWVGELTADQLPDSTGAGRGWLASANNDPFGFTADGKIEGDAHYFGVFYDPGTRAARIDSELSRLVATGDVTSDDLEALQADTHSVFADELIPLLEEVFATVDADPDLAPYRDRPELVELHALLTAWDRKMERESPAALAFDAFMWFAAAGALRDDMTLAFDTVAEASGVYVLKWSIMTLTRRFEAAEGLMQEGRSVILMEALSKAAEWLTTTYGSVAATDYQWADLHHTRFVGLWGDALDRPPIPSDGGDGTVHVANGAFLRDGEPVDRIESTGGAAYRMVMGFDDDGTPHATVSFPPGNDGEPGSPFFDNNLEDWLEDRFQPLPYRTDDVVAATVEETVLLP